MIKLLITLPIIFILIYFLLYRRIIDVYFIGVGGLIFYYAPMMVMGHTLDIDTFGRLITTSALPVENRLQLYILISLIIFFIFSLVDDFRFRSELHQKHARCNGVGFFFITAFLILIALLVVILVRIDWAILSSKIHINEMAGPFVTFYLYFYATAIFSYSTIRKYCSRFYRYVFDLFFACLTCFGLFVLDHKMGMLIPLLSLFIYKYLHVKVLLKVFFMFFIVGLIVVGLVLSKNLFLESFSYYDVLIELEGFFIASLGNFLIGEKHYLDGEYLFYFPIMFYPLLKKLSDYPSTYFNDSFQEMYFPNADFGMAYNFYAELNASGVGFFLLPFLGVGMLVLNLISKKCVGYVRFSCIYLMIYCVFFLHRQSIFVVASIVGNYIFISCALFCIGYMFSVFLKGARVK